MRRRLIALVAAALAGAGVASPAAAQLFPRRSAPAPAPCVLDKCLGGPVDAAPRQPGGFPLAPGAFDFYVLSLSWSPGFCDSGGAARAGDQCVPGAGLGFVVHGLWPQNARGYPSNCEGARGPGRVPPGLYPSIGLALHEWRTHGTCTGLAPADYFAAVRRARDAVTIPPAFQAPQEPQTLAPLDIARAVVAANPGLRTDMMAVTCRGDELAELRLCFTKDLRGFTSCPEVARAGCRTRAVSVLPVQ